MGVIEQNYRLEGFLILLNEDCITPRYYPLIPLKSVLLEGFRAQGCRTKRDCAGLTDDELTRAGIADGNMAALFRRFLSCYDINETKLKALEKYAASREEKAALAELFRLPGVQLTRASLYYASGYTCLRDIAAVSSGEIIAAAADAIRKNRLECVPPLPKEARTHIAVAKVLTEYTA